MNIPPGETVLAAYRNPLDATPIRTAALALSEMRVYRGFETGSSSSARRGVSSASQKYPLEENGGNLALVLQEMDFLGALKNVVQYLNRLSSRFEDIKIRAEGGISQLYVQERGLNARTPATHLSDGTLRFLCLMAILLNPKPPRLLGIEEPETGLHPDALVLVADALREASTRAQIVVTTHSDALVDRFGDHPQAVVICDRGLDEGTCFQRLSPAKLREWLQDYSLGDLGGTQR